MKKIVFEQDKQNYIPADFEVINLSKVNIICASEVEKGGGISDFGGGDDLGGEDYYED